MHSALSTVLQQLPLAGPDLQGVPPAAQAPVLAGLLLKDLGPTLVVTGSQAEAERLALDLQALLPPERGARALMFPEIEMSVFDEGASDPARLQVLQHLHERQPVLVVTSLLALLQPVSAPEALRSRVLRSGQKLDRGALLETLERWGYHPVLRVQRPGEYSVHGLVLDLYPGREFPCRLEFCDEQLSEIREFDPDSQLSLGTLPEVRVGAMREQAREATLLDYLAPDRPLVLLDPAELQPRLQRMGRAAALGRRFSTYEDIELLHNERPDDWTELLESFEPRPVLRVCAAGQAQVPWEEVPSFASLSEFGEWISEQPGARVVVTLRPSRVKASLTRRGLHDVQVLEGWLSRGVVCGNWLSLVGDRELYGHQRPVSTPAPGPEPELLPDFAEGDLVVYRERGIARFEGLTTVELMGNRRDLLVLRFANEDALRVPPEQIEQLTAYRGVGAEPPALSRLGTKSWSKTLAQVQAAVAELATHFREGRARRAPAPALPPDSPRQQEMEAAFGYDETPSQLTALAEIKRDLEEDVAMNRLLCGDVGYGKTEVAVRAAFKVAEAGLQVAVLVPTSVLARQHWESFRARLTPFGVEVGALWSGYPEAESVQAGLADGSLPVVVGTHSLLAESLRFSRLGLLIVDEEQQFGVAHKERLAQLSRGVHVLSMSATPIPRTLQLALAGVRDISLLDAPPESKRPVRTYLIPEQPRFIQAALMRELEREGQAFVLHNKVEELPRLAGRLARAVAGLRVGVAHGQMPGADLNTVLEQFRERELDVLVCSTIIESGLDFPNANTMIVKDAQRFGLAQLYQIRGRVGRAGRQAYCYLFTPPRARLSEKARLRLETIREFTELGAGFQIAMRDLEIRGAGDLLGEGQTGHMGRVGYHLYRQLLHEALQGATLSPPPATTSPEQSGATYIPEDYLAETAERVALYRRLATLENRSQCERLERELRDRFGPLPEPVQNLLARARQRIAAA